MTNGTGPSTRATFIAYSPFRAGCQLGALRAALRPATAGLVSHGGPLVRAGLAQLRTAGSLERSHPVDSANTMAPLGAAQADAAAPEPMCCAAVDGSHQRAFSQADRRFPLGRGTHKLGSRDRNVTRRTRSPTVLEHGLDGPDVNVHTRRRSTLGPLPWSARMRKIAEFGRGHGPNSQTSALAQKGAE